MLMWTNIPISVSYFFLVCGLDGGWPSDLSDGGWPSDLSEEADRLTCRMEADRLTCWMEADRLTCRMEADCLTCQGHPGHSNAWGDTDLQPFWEWPLVFGLAIFTTPLSRHFTSLYWPSQQGFILSPFFDSLAEFLSQTKLPDLKG